MPTLIRRLWTLDIPYGALALTAMARMAATCVTFLGGIHDQVLGGLWLALPWWFAFSGDLWYHDHRARPEHRPEPDKALEP